MNRITEENKNKAESLIREIMEYSDAKGMAVRIIDHTGKVQYENFFGYRNEETKEPVNEDTIFGLASVTKSFTALSIMMMAEDGIISLDDPISKHLPYYKDKNQKPVTIRHLLSHAGGYFPLPRILVEPVAESIGLKEGEEGDLAYNEKLAEEGGRLVAERLDSLTMEDGLNGVPGEYCSYCNDGFGLLSEIIRLKGDQPSFAEYVREHITKPLHMERSFCDFMRGAEDDNAAVLYRTEDGKLIADRDYHDNAFVLNGGGAMKSTLKDLTQYLCMYLNDGKGLDGTRIISEYAVREMAKPRMPFGRTETYGYGLYSRTVDQMHITGHGGSLPGVSSNIAFTKDNDCAVIVLCNTSDVPVAAVSEALLKMYHGTDPSLKKEEFREYPWSDEIRNQVCGTYSSGEGTNVVITTNENNELKLICDDKEKDFLMITPFTGIVRGKYSDTDVELIMNESRGLYAIRYGSRLIPKKNDA